MKVLAIIQARMCSSRLPGKVLMKFSGKPLLQHIVENLQHCNYLNEIIIATTILPEDQKIRDFAKSIGIKCFSGDPDDVLKRYYDCAKLHNGDIILRVTGDSPLTDCNLTDMVIKTCIDFNCDYVSNVLHLTYPLGYNSGEAVPFKILKYLHDSQLDSLSREHVTFHIRNNPQLYEIKEIKAPLELQRSNWRLTVDYPEDYELLVKIFDGLYDDDFIIDYKKLVDYLDSHPELYKINQKYAIKSIKDNINPVKDNFYR